MGDCGDSNSSKVQNKRFVLPNVAAGPEYKVRVRLPAGLSCTQEAPCTLQWTYMTGNSVDSYPEVFRNCADFKLGSANDVASTAAPATTPEPEPEPESTLAPTTTTTTTTTMTTTTAAPATTAASSATTAASSPTTAAPATTTVAPT